MTEYQEATKAKILIVEDEALIALDLKIYLQELGYSVLGQAFSAEKALELIEQDLPDLILMDIVLQGKMDGIEVADIIHFRWGIPVIFTTAYADKERIERAKLTYPFGYLMKPYQERDIEVTIEMALYVSKVEAERRKAEEALRQSEERMRSIFLAAPIGIGVVVDRVFKDVNQRFCDMTGYTQNELLNRSARMIYPSDSDYEKVGKEKYAKIAEKGTGSVETRFRRKDGTVIDVLLSSTPIDRTELSRGVTFTALDITERKRAETVLQENEERYRSLFENMLNGLAYCRMLFENGHPIDFVYLAVNQAFESLTGLKGVVGKKVSEVIPGIRQDDPELFAAYGRVARSGKPERFEIYLKALKMWFSVSVYSPEQEYFVAVFDVITARKQAEEESQRLLTVIQQERDKLAGLINSINDEIWFADNQKKFTLVNPAALREFGFDPSTGEIDVENLAASLEVFRPDGSPRPLEEAPPLRALKGELVKNQEEIVRTPLKEDLRYRQVSSSPVREAGGNIIGAVSVVRDITDIKQAEEQVKISLKEKEILLKEIYHRMKNNMGVISSILSLQSKFVKDKASQEIFRDCVHRVKCMAKIHAALYQAKNLAHIDFNTYLKELTNDLFTAYQVKPDTVTLKLQVKNFTPAIDTAIPLGLILNELLSNSLKYAFIEGRKGEIQVHLRKEDDRIILKVTDNGMGFPEEIDFTDTKSLGLQLVMALVDQLNGTIEMKRDQGTVFTVTFQEVK